MTTTTSGRRLGAALGVCVVLAGGCGSADGDERASPAGGPRGADLDGSITVFAAASLTDAFDEIGDAFVDRHPGVTVDLNLAGSQALREQILEGAPGDVFASANTSNMDQVVEAGAAEDPVTFAHNVLEIAVPAGNPAGVEGLDDLGRSDLLIGLCAAEVPCGDFGRQALDAAGVTPAPDTEEPDVRSLLTKVAEGDLDAGLVYRSDVLSAGDDVEGVEIPAEVNVVADYPAAPLTGSSEPDIAAAFVDFLLGGDSRRILAAWGFEPA